MNSVRLGHGPEVKVRVRSESGFSGISFLEKNINFSPAAPHSNRASLQKTWGRSFEELESLSHERDARVFYSGLLEIGCRLEDNDQLELAAMVYSALIAGSATPSISTRAQTRLNALTGVGNSGERIAFLARRVSTEATRPDMLIAMGAAGAAFRLTRLAATAKLAGTLESGWGLRAAGNISGFFAETVAFTGVGKLAGAGLGYHQEWNSDAVFREWAGGATMLLGLKVAGAGVGALSRRWAAAETTFGRFTQTVAPQVGMFGGILAGNRLAEFAGFHPHREGDTWFVDGLSTLLQFNVAGQIQRGALGEGFQRFERRIDLHTEVLTRSVGAGSARPLSTAVEPGRQTRPLQEILGWMTESFGPDFVTPEGISLSQSEIPAKGGPASGGENSSRPLLSVGNDDESGRLPGGSLGTGGFAGPEALRVLPQRYENRFRNGSVLIEIATHQALDAGAALNLLKRWEDGFSNLLLNSKSRISEKIRGPVAVMIRRDPELQSHLIRHLEGMGHRILVRIDVESGLLHHAIAVDDQGRPRYILVAGEEQHPKKPYFGEDYLLQLEVYNRHSEIPWARGRRFFYDAMTSQLSEVRELEEGRYNGVTRIEAFEEPQFEKIKGAPVLTVTFEREGLPEFSLFLGRTGPARWGLQDASGRWLFEMSPQILQATVNQRNMPLSSLPPPPSPAAVKDIPDPLPKIPKAPKMPQIPAHGKPRAGTKPYQPPPTLPVPAAPKSLPPPAPRAPSPQPEEKLTKRALGLQAKVRRAALPESLKSSPPTEQAMWLLGEACHILIEGDRISEKVFPDLLTLAQKIPTGKFEGFATQLFEDSDLLLRSNEFDPYLFAYVLKKLPEGRRNWALVKLADTLGEKGPVAAHAFDVFREVIPRLGNGELISLREFLETRFRLGGHEVNILSMVYQTRVLIKDQFKKK